jgi:hypothetical protein
MRTKVFLFTIIILLIPKVILSQKSENQDITTYKKNQIGIQLNPVINDQLFDTQIMNTVAALRYGYRITKNLTTGFEFSCSFPININSSQFSYFNSFEYKTGIYARYSILSERRFQIFAEASPFFSHYWKELTSSFDLTPYRSHRFGYYVAPGLTLYSKSKRVSFDLYYKFSNFPFSNGKKSVLSYKVNFNF